MESFMVKKGRYAARIAVWVADEEHQGDLGYGRDACLLDPGTFQGQTLTLWKGVDY